jgi:hypothetical protein
MTGRKAAPRRRWTAEQKRAIVAESLVVGASVADSDDSSHRFRPKPASYSDRSQPGIPMIPAGWRRGS